ncbi:hypothetical protein M2T28_14545 [Elizabethkingia miricola]|uniref:hypothetical protein n=1 Tax=Elizabethkingia TaxID=308865 RepID=UPI00061BF12D|nr:MULTISPECIES: hypothetical protein [Elizabethkingia]MCL1653839.1 hypothetical protein [Elizabethkingia miricola]QCO45814.1 hypothetical protein FCS00_05300 [Elizabethkingia sp. 2-6]WQM37645.1 hypothetical protein U2S95_14895 [Elizabethkingia miricola]CRH24897.1 Uncharacterised protein [Chlamydia trachomatis]
MFHFSDFNIKPKENAFTGKKIDIDDILNIEIIIYKYQIKDSTKKSNTKYLTLQIEIDKIQRIVFTGSKNLIDLITQVPEDKFPFFTTIKKNDRRLEFT